MRLSRPARPATSTTPTSPAAGSGWPPGDAFPRLSCRQLTQTPGSMSVISTFFTTTFSTCLKAAKTQMCSRISTRRTKSRRQNAQNQEKKGRWSLCPAFTTRCPRSRSRETPPGLQCLPRCAAPVLSTSLGRLLSFRWSLILPSFAFVVSFLIFSSYPSIPYHSIPL